jgi:hypothetical protein
MFQRIGEEGKLAQGPHGMSFVRAPDSMQADELRLRD